jgi:hypothetical protein
MFGDLCKKELFLFGSRFFRTFSVLYPHQGIHRSLEYNAALKSQNLRNPNTPFSILCGSAG